MECVRDDGGEKEGRARPVGGRVRELEVDDGGVLGVADGTDVEECFHRFRLDSEDADPLPKSGDDRKHRQAPADESAPHNSLFEVQLEV